MFVGLVVPRNWIQKMSERLTLLSGISLCRSQYSYGPKKFQFGPAEERAQEDQDDPEHDEAVLERDVGELAVVVACK